MSCFKNSKKLRSFYYKLQIALGRFASREKEFKLIPQLLGEGDIAIDIGANVGHYSLEFAKRVGKRGLVISFEPVLEPYEFLISNLSFKGLLHIVMVNRLCVSDKAAIVGMEVPKWAGTESDNFYRSKMKTNSFSSDRKVMSVALDQFLPGDLNLSLVKIDVEGFEDQVIIGALRTIKRTLPVLIIEDISAKSQKLLERLDYQAINLGSHNTIFIHKDRKGLLARIESYVF